LIWVGSDPVSHDGKRFYQAQFGRYEEGREMKGVQSEQTK